MTTHKAAHERVLSACAVALQGPLAELAEFLDSPLPHPAYYREGAAVRMPVVRHLEEARDWTTPDFAELVDAVIEGAEHFHWRTSYSSKDGIDEDFLERYGYFNLVSPEGPFLCRDYRLTVAFWGSGLIYPEHRHEPEELYALIAGAVRFRAEGRAPRDVKPGEFVHHPPWVTHATDMLPGPMLAVVGWRGENLMRFAKMTAGVRA